ncbi:hypothetical protein NC652_015957 [Populus alba x Populus x berolinensis]|nr:hypothetical protein NC652_015957 [Populus alba x Populus x berolinensis]
MEMNELVALDVGTVKGLILMLVIRKRKLSVVPPSSILVSLYNEDERSIACARITFKEDGHSVSLLHNAITLINTCNIEQLETIPSKLSEKFLDSMKRLWEKVHNQMLHGDAWMSFQERDLNLSNFTVYNLAESIFSFSINTSEFVIPLPSVGLYNSSEFWLTSIAAVANALTSLFDQPTGLDSHFDDHCVFVCQLFGTKQWTIYSQPNLQLPRLYDPLDREQCFVEENSLAGYRKFLLREGDILFIPRGFPHEACTHDGGSSDLARFSLHVTFGIEVEPPFEWEGFAHVALHCWYQTQKQLHRASVEPLSGILDLMPVTLLHLMIELIGASDSTLREASLVGAHFCL